MHEGAAAGGEPGDDPPMHQDAADRLVAGAEPLGDDLDVGRHALLFPGMQRAGTAHAAHHLVEDQQRAMPVADLPHAGK